MYSWHPGMQALLPFLVNTQLGPGNTGQDIFRQMRELPRTPGEAIQRLSRFTPRSYAGLLPSQRELMASLVSGLGVEPADWMTSIERSMPTGVNPAFMGFGNFARGGRVVVAPA